MERLIGLIGIALMLGVGWIVSTERGRIDWRSVAAGMALQVVIALLVLQTPFGERFFGWLNDLAGAFIGATDTGIDFVFGRWPDQLMGAQGETVQLPFVFAIRVLPIVIFMSSVFSVLYHFGVLQIVVELLARGLRRTLRVSGAESLATVANVFLGMTEAPLMVRPYVAAMTRSELFLVMTAGLSTVAGSVLVAYMNLVGPEYAGHLIAASFMSAPAAIVYAKMIVPEVAEPKTLGASGALHTERQRSQSVNVIDAAAAGALDGLRLALNIGAILLAFVALIGLVDSALANLAAPFGVADLSLGRLLGYALAPVAWLLGVPWQDAATVGELLGFKTVVNEFLAYQMLAGARAGLEPRSIVVASYALCGFANFGSLAILLGGLGGIAPERRGDVARDGMRAILAGSLATFTTGAIAGLLLR